MQNTPPSKFPIPWANSAGTSYIRSIPTSSQTGVTPGAASLQDGFPPLTFTPISAGGIPPFGQDMNGILNQVTAWLRWLQAGGAVGYDSNFQTAIGGYPSGAIVGSTKIPGLLWRSIVDNNTSNPDSGGAGWTRQILGRVNVLAPITANGLYTPSSPNVYMIEVTAVGGGGAGGGGFNTSGVAAYATGSGGGSGAIINGAFNISTIGLGSQQVSIGGGGVPVSGQNGGNGGTTTFGGLLAAPGGGGGLMASISAGQGIQAGQGAPGGVPAIASGSIIFYAGGQPGMNGFVLSSGPASGIGAPSPLGGGGGANTNNGAGGNATGWGAGGGGGATLQNAPPNPGGSGGQGVVLITEYY